MPTKFKGGPGYGLLLLAVLSGGSTNVASAEKAAGLGLDNEDAYFSELPVISTASRLPQRIQDAPAAVSIIDREMIKAMGARDISDLLRMVPGFETFGRTTNSPRVTYHGILDAAQSSRIQVLIDGRSQFSPLFDGGVNWSLLPVALEDIERIEVVRGSNASSYGGNAFQALVNIITVDPTLVHGTSVSASHGNQSVRDYTLRQSDRLGEAGDYRLTYQSKQDSGLNNRDTWVDGYQSQMIDWRSDITINNQDSLQINAGHMQSSMPDPDGKIGDITNPVHDDLWSTTYLQANWRRVWSSDSEIQLRYAFADDQAKTRYDGLAPLGKKIYPFTYDPNGSHSTRHELEFVHHLGLSEQIKMVWGSSYRLETVDSPLLFLSDTERSRSVGRIFSSLEWKPLQAVTANLGLSEEHDSVVGWMPSSRASLNFHLNPQNTLRFGISRSQRAGSLMDYYGGQNVMIPGAGDMVTTRGNPDLGVERLKGSEIGYLGSWKDLGMHLDIRLFNEHIPNRWFTLQSLYPDCTSHLTLCYYTIGKLTALKTTVPTQDVHTQGVEYSWTWTPWQETKLVLNQAFVRIKSDFLPDIQDNSGPYLLAGNNFSSITQLTNQSTPRRSTSLLLTQKLPYGFEFSAFSQWVGAMKWRTNSSNPAYNRIDARLGYPFRWDKTRGEIALTVQTLDGSHGEFDGSGSTPSDHIMERRSWLSLRFDL